MLPSPTRRLDGATVARRPWTRGHDLTGYVWYVPMVCDYRIVFFQGARVTAQLAIYSIAIGLRL